MTNRLPQNCLRGVLLPFTTPFNAVGEIDAASLKCNLRSWREKGIAGFVVGGSTGERVHLDEPEYIELVRLARAEVSRSADGQAFIAGAGQQSTRGTINEVVRSASSGADAVLVITPNFYRSAITQQALILHYTAIADASPVPILLYSMPDLTGIKIQPETVASLSTHKNIIGVKDSSNDIPGLQETISLVRDTASVGPEDFVILSGNGTVLLDALRAGADGAILAVGCAVPELCLAIFRAFKSGALDHATALQEKLTPLARAVTSRFGIGGLKAAMHDAGYYGGPVRAPLRSPDEAALAEIVQLLRDAQAALAQPVTEPEAATLGTVAT